MGIDDVVQAYQRSRPLAGMDTAQIARYQSEFAALYQQKIGPVEAQLVEDIAQLTETLRLVPVLSRGKPPMEYVREAARRLLGDSACFAQGEYLKNRQLFSPEEAFDIATAGIQSIIRAVMNRDAASSPFRFMPYRIVEVAEERESMERTRERRSYAR